MLSFTLLSCDEIAEFLGLDVAEAGRPAIPEPESYIASVPTISEKLVIASVTPSNYTPVATSARNSDGNEIFTGQNERISLRLNGNPVASPTSGTYEGLMELAAAPELQLVRYWVRISGVERYPGGTTTSETRSHTEGLSGSSSYSFTETLGVSATGGGGVGAVEVEVTVSAEFSATQTYESSFESSQTVEHTVTIAPESGVNIVFCTWQLYEEFRLVNAIRNADGEYESFTDPNYDFASESTSPMIFETPVIRSVTYKYDA